MQVKFTERFNNVMHLANQEARRFKHEYMDTEYLLLGLVKLGAGLGVEILKKLNVDPIKIGAEVIKIIQFGPEMAMIGKLHQTPRTKKGIEYAIEEARTLNHNYVGTEHLLLGMLREREGVAGMVLMNLGVTPEKARDELSKILG